MTAPREAVEADALPLTQFLVMEVLAARHRTGETRWTFPTKATPAVRALEDHGLVRWKSGIVERTILVWLTDLGRELFLLPDYVSPDVKAAIDSLGLTREWASDEVPGRSRWSRLVGRWVETQP